MKFNIDYFKKYLREEKLDSYEIEKIASYVEDYVRFGKRKPYMTLNEYNSKFDKEVEYLKSIEKKFNNAYLLKITSTEPFAWSNIKTKLKYFIRDLKERLGNVEYYVWTKAITDTNYVVNICFDFNDKKVNKKTLSDFIKLFWFCINTYKIKQVSDINEIVDEFKLNAHPNLQENDKHTWYLRNAKLFMESEKFNIEEYEDFKYSHYAYKYGRKSRI